MIRIDDKYKLVFQADLFDIDDADVIIAEDVTLPEAIEILNSRDIACFVLGGRGMANRISVGGGLLRRMGWYETEEYEELLRQGRLEVRKSAAETGN